MWLYFMLGPESPSLFCFLTLEGEQYVFYDQPLVTQGWFGCPDHGDSCDGAQVGSQALP